MRVTAEYSIQVRTDPICVEHSHKSIDIVINLYIAMSTCAFPLYHRHFVEYVTQARLSE